MIFVDTNVFMYAVGRPHPLQAVARKFFEASAIPGHPPLCTSAEVLQELLHAYLPVRRVTTLDAALRLAHSMTAQIWNLEPEDVEVARALADEYPALDGRDLAHLASCRRRGVERIETFDRALAAVGKKLR